ncbi:MAG TPA: transposase [Cyclobacteriaceae bacterium]|jgi:putative transposase|nr:transposase [Cytophagales bacterium]HMR57509.1 transposase [Cyclobacteriaceae bacterium]HRE67758.1 transposase [Cyclobacteriaceae bacterium]HRF34548.1 transposase [Cyclobacteriaceae bacterium]
MNLAPESLYHLYNRGNNKQVIFPQERNYSYFLTKAHHEFKAEIDFLAYCMMPNHFHFLIFTKPEYNSAKFTNALRTLLSSYTRAINKQQNTTGSLFQQNTRSIEISSDTYSSTCFHYIHQNPLRAGLFQKIEDWPHHSFSQYWKNPEGICNVHLGHSLINISNDSNQFYKDSYRVIPEEYLLKISLF